MRRLLALVVAVVLLLTGCSSLQGTEGKQYVGSDFQSVEYTPSERGTPIESSGTTIDGKPLDLADYRGKVVVFNIWWSGCGPCIKELPLLVDATTSLGPDVALVGLNIRDASAANAAAFERDLGVDFPSIYAPGGDNLLDFDNKISPRSIPSTAVLDQQGRLAALLTGPIPSEQTLISVVQTVLAADAPGSADG